MIVIVVALCLVLNGCLAAKSGDEAGRDVTKIDRPATESTATSQPINQSGGVNVATGPKTGDAWSERIAVGAMFVITVLASWFLARRYGYESGRARRLKRDQFE